MQLNNSIVPGDFGLLRMCFIKNAFFDEVVFLVGYERMGLTARKGTLLAGWLFLGFFVPDLKPT